MISLKPPPKPTKRPLREAVTIVAGFKSHEGVVLCADTQETIGQLSKHNVPKLRFEPFNFSNVMGGEDANNLAVAFCGATDNGPFLDMVIDKAWNSAKESSSLAEACSAIEDSIKATIHEYGNIYQTGYLPSTEIIYGVKMDEDSKLFYAFGPAITEKTDYVTAGQGVHLANFLAGRMHQGGLDIKQAIILAAYILFQTKEHVEGCGGSSQIAVLRETGTSGTVHWENIEAITKLLKHADQDFGEILMQYADLTLSKKDFLDKAKFTLDVICAVRDLEGKNLKEANQMWRDISGLDMHDELGLPNPPEKIAGDIERTLGDFMQSGDQKTEGQP